MVYFSKTEQPLHVGDVDQMLHLASEDRAVVVPHRAQPFGVKSDFQAVSIKNHIWQYETWPVAAGPGNEFKQRYKPCNFKKDSSVHHVWG